jgi:L-malate glycosyltransferase
MQKIKVLHIIKSLGRGGAEMLLPETLKLHDQTRFEFHYIYFLPWKNQMEEDIRNAGGKVICIGARNNIQIMLRAKRVANYVKEHSIELIHAHLPWAGVLARIVGKMTGVSVVYTEHNKQERYHFITRFINLATLKYLREIVAVSNDVSESIHKYKPGIKIPVRTILNGVNTTHFNPDRDNHNSIRKSLNIPLDSPVIGTIAVFRFQKRLDLWVSLASNILKVLPKAHFIIVGDGPLKALIVEKIKQLKIEQSVHLVGLQTEVRPYLAAFDVYMMSSIFEGLPIALLEAMASGCAVVSTDAGGIKEVIQPNVNGILCSVDDAQCLTDGVIDLINNTEKRKVLGTGARKRIENAFSMNKMVTELEALYESLVLNENRNDAVTIA